MHGRRLREHRRSELDRIERFSSLSMRALRKLITELLKQEMDVWDKARRWKERDEDPDESGVCFVMANHYIQWSARRAKALHEDLEALRGGKDTYILCVTSRNQSYSGT